jgi:hypothetical protein
MEYEKTQHGGFHYIPVVAAIAMLVDAGFSGGEPVAMGILLGMALLFALFALMFATLTVRDEGECLSLRYGPLPVFGKRIRYVDITCVEPGRTSIIDGWGIHWILGRGTTYNLWGFGCVKLTLDKKVIRVGSNDVDNLVRFLRARIMK